MPSPSSSERRVRGIVPVVVLASYRGASYIREQIASIQSQTHSGWRLLVRDDASDDGTSDLIHAEAERDPRIEVINDSHGRMGVVANFSILLERALADGAEWVAICDQDDHWLPSKLERQLAAVQQIAPPRDLPLLLHSDASVVDRHLELIHPSLHRFMGLRHEATTPLATLLIQNFVTGCSCLVNRAALEIALPVPAECVMYDWWLALCTAASGRVSFQSQPMLLYRQHSANELGARSVQGMLRDLVRRSFAGNRQGSDEFMDTLLQAAALEKRLYARVRDGEPDGVLRERMSESLAFVSSYLDLYGPDVGRIRRVVALHRRQIRRQSRVLDTTLKLKMLTSTIQWPPESLLRPQHGPWT